MNIVELRKIIEESIKELYEKDSYLIKHDVHEQSISHKLACYIATRVLSRKEGGWDVDAEYNRNREVPKSLMKIYSEEKYSEKEFEEKRVKVRPDILIHRRGQNNDNGTEDNNLLIIEVKKMPAEEAKKFDIEKIKKFIEGKPYFYKFGIFIELGNSIKDCEYNCFYRDDKNRKAVKYS